jgi:hypothetical protein
MSAEEAMRLVDRVWRRGGLRVGGIVPLPLPDEAFPSTYPFLHEVLDQVEAECLRHGVPAYGTLTARGVHYQHGHLVPAVRWQLALCPPPRPSGTDRAIMGAAVGPVVAGYTWAVQQAMRAEQQAAYDARIKEANDALPTHLSPMPGVRRARRGRHLMGPRKMGEGGWLRTVFGASPKASPVKHKGCLGNLWLLAVAGSAGLFLAGAVEAARAMGN